MKVILKTPGDQQYRLDLPGATRDDCDLLCRWLAHLLTPHQVAAPGQIPWTFSLEVW